jgi:DNA polymerase, archaea type
LTTTVSGWLFDTYPLNDKMVFWIKQEGKNSATTIRLEDDSWAHSIYAASDDKISLNSILYAKDKRLSNLVKHCEFKSHYEKITDIERSDVLRLALIDSTKALILARIIESIFGHGKVRLYNVDLLPAQSYFYKHDVLSIVTSILPTSNFYTYIKPIVNRLMNLKELEVNVVQ